MNETVTDLSNSEGRSLRKFSINKILSVASKSSLQGNNELQSISALSKLSEVNPSRAALSSNIYQRL
jgi:hypothetical protein